MNRWLIAIIGIMLLVWIGVIGYQSTETTSTPGPPPNELFTEELLLYQAVDAEGNAVGPVDGLVVERKSAEAIYAVVRLEDIYDFGKGSAGPQDRFLLIPWAHLQVNAAQQQLIVDVDAAVLAGAPSYFELPNTATPAWDQEIRHFWAGPPVATD